MTSDLAVRSRTMRIGIDVGGTKIEGLALGAGGAELLRHRVATPAAYDDVLQAIAAVVSHLEEETGGRGSVGIGTPGILQPGTGTMRNSNLLCLNDRRLDKDLASALGRAVRLDNDASCFVLSEAVDGAAARPARDAKGEGADVVFGATLGTGVGGGIAIDARVHSGANGAAAEWSHTTLPFLRDGEKSPYACFCGHHECIESFTSGRGLAGAYREVTGRDVDGPEVAKRAAAGDDAADRAFSIYEDRLARALAGVINLLDPRVIVLGGGLSNNERIFAGVRSNWERYTVAKDLRTQLVKAKHGDASGVRGAAFLWPEK
jgi:fructokinase